jgi:D-alanyl-D-alanine carboxypeptidase
MSTPNWDEIWLKLGISSDLISSCRLPLQEEATGLVTAGLDVFDREQFVTPQTLNRWQEMRSAAEKDGITLLIVSAYRSVDYQCQLIKDKLARGQSIEDIVRISAIPGFSEHHSGRAIDITTDDCKPLEEEFDETKAFDWLESNASKFDFVMSYPKDNPFEIIYEPWHWACQRID